MLKDLVKIGCREHPILRLHWLYQKDPFKNEHLIGFYKWHLIQSEEELKHKAKIFQFLFLNDVTKSAETYCGIIIVLGE